MKKLLLIILIFFIAGCFRTKITKDIKEAKLTETQQKVIEAQNLIKQAIKYYELKNYQVSLNLLKKSIDLYNFIEKFDKKNENLNTAYYYRGMCYLNLIAFEKAVKELKKIPENSKYFSSAKIALEKIKIDTDNDGFNNAWEEISNTDTNNPLSHP